MRSALGFAQILALLSILSSQRHFIWIQRFTELLAEVRILTLDLLLSLGDLRVCCLATSLSGVGVTILALLSDLGFARVASSLRLRSVSFSSFLRLGDIGLVLLG